MEVLRCIGQSRDRIGVSEIAKQTRLTQSNVWRICYTLRSLGYLSISPSGEVQPGLPLLSLGYAALAGESVHTIAKPFLTELAERFEAAAGIATRDGLSMVYMERSEGNAMLTFNLRIGSTVPIMASAMGWSYLASLSERERRELLAQIKRRDPAQWRTNIKPFEAALAEADDDGFILCIDAFHPGVGMAAVALRHPQGGGAAYTVNCGGLSALLTRDVLRREVGPALLSAKEKIERLLASVRTIPPAAARVAR